jgi:hypothetical protein
MNYASTFLIAISSAAALGCSGYQYRGMEKRALLKNTSVFASREENQSHTKASLKLPVGLVCYDIAHGVAGHFVNPKSKIGAAVLTEDLTDVVCDDQSDHLSEILSERSFTLQREGCNLKPNGRYTLALYDTQIGTSRPFVKAGITVDAEGNPSFEFRGYWVVAMVWKEVEIGSKLWLSSFVGCDKKVYTAIGSPLVIKTNPIAKGPIPLSSQEDGIFFDILGFASTPRPFTKKRISWMKTPDYRFLVKPNAFGLVTGIQELFGNNTRGPDLAFARDGYHALGKYDLNRDRKIDRQDPVFYQLRLWADLNGDGLSQPDELDGLTAHQIVSIDLDYDDSFFEADAYGNQTRMKSAARTVTGEDLLIFDLWFHYWEN